MKKKILIFYFTFSQISPEESFYRYLSEITAETIIYFAQLVKQYTNSRNVTDEQILNRAVCLQKPAVVISLLKKLPSDMKVHKLIKVLRGWTTPEILLNHAVQEFRNELNSWKDEYGNSFFWYLYSLPNLVSKNMVDLLPEELLCAFDHPNCYGISPEDFWLYYRKGIQFPEQ